MKKRETKHRKRKIGRGEEYEDIYLDLEVEDARMALSHKLWSTILTLVARVYPIFWP